MPKTSTTKKKTTRKKAPVKKTVAKKPERFIEAVGRRKTAVARVRITPQKTRSFIVNAKGYQEYFQSQQLQNVVMEALDKAHLSQEFAVSVITKGGGMQGQAEATRHGISRALIKFQEDLKAPLKELGFLTRDPRMRERKKFGLKRARRARQWRKR
ncbi:MAG: 30S ribosomal protein S9 [Patescibacteria group bacterium]|nr:30S ribosomal protein S9 [Patescibacteria group bacterium]